MHPSPGAHGRVHVMVAGDWFGSAPQYSCQSSHLPSELSPPQFGQLLQSQVFTHAPRGEQWASGTQYSSVPQVVVSHGSGSTTHPWLPSGFICAGHVQVAFPPTTSHCAQRPQVTPVHVSSASQASATA